MQAAQWVAKFQRGPDGVGPQGHALTGDGLRGPATSWALAIADLPRQRRDVVRIATAFHGESEWPDQANRGPLPDRCNAFVGAPLGSPWCAAFVSLVLAEAGVSAIKTASARLCLQQFPPIDREDPKPPLPGDLFGWVNPDGTGHVGFVIGQRFALVGIAPSHVITLEGNSANRVRICARPLAGLFFARLPDAARWPSDVPSAPVVARETQGTR